MECPAYCCLCVPFIILLACLSQFGGVKRQGYTHMLVADTQRGSGVLAPASVCRKEGLA
jgi:hypothetical protein